MRFVITQSGFDNNCLKLRGVIMTIKAKEWSNFIHKRAPKFVCPVCGHNQWQIQSGNKSEMLTMNVKSPMNQICEALGELIVENGGQLPEDDTDAAPTQFLEEVLLVRCGNCGWIGMFDQAYIKSLISDDN